MKICVPLSLCLLVAAHAVSAQDQPEPQKPGKLLKKPRIYNALVKSDEELIPSQSYPAVAPVIRPFYTGLFPYAPVIVPQVHQYGPEEYGNLKVSPDYGEERTADYPSTDLTPPSLNQPKPTYRAPSINVDQAPFGLKEEAPQDKQQSLDQRFDFSKNSTPKGTPQRNTQDNDRRVYEEMKKFANMFSQPLNYEGDLSPTGMDDSYFPQNMNAKNQPQQQPANDDYDSFLQPPPSPESKKAFQKENSNGQRESSGSQREQAPSSKNTPEVISPFLLQNFFNYQPEDSAIPNVPPPPLPVSNNNNNSTKKKVDYPNAPPTLFSL